MVAMGETVAQFRFALATAPLVLVTLMPQAVLEALRPMALMALVVQTETLDHSLYRHSRFSPVAEQMVSLALPAQTGEPAELEEMLVLSSFKVVEL
jgi:hypothetical protein